MIHIRYRPEIDGLRALAVLMVVTFHAFPGALPGGFVGVDVFFVISGYLITEIIARSLRDERFAFAEFYRRRIQRIFPALLLVLCSTLLAGWYVLSASEYASLGREGAAGAAFLSNLIQYTETGYFAVAASWKPLLHLWSLGVEEQYYIVWPAILYVAYQLRISMLRVACALAMASFLCNVALVDREPILTFYMPFTRFWELLIGSILACALVLYPVEVEQLRARYGIALSVVGISLIALAAALLRVTYAFPGWWALLPTLGAAAIVGAPGHVGLNSAVLGKPPLVFFGKISYPLYLWHWPLLAFARILAGQEPAFGMRLLAVTVAIAVAWLTTVAVERPLRFGSSRRFKVAGLITGCVAVGVSARIIQIRDGVPTRPVAALTNNFAGAATEWTYVEPAFHGGHLEIKALLGTNSDFVLFMGDSMMAQYYPRLEVLYSRAERLPNLSAKFAARSGCRPVPHGEAFNHRGYPCEEVYQATLALAHRADCRRVVIAGLWNVILSDAGARDNREPMIRDFRELRAAGKEIVLLSMGPHSDGMAPLFLAARLRSPFESLSNRRLEASRTRSLPRATVASTPEEYRRLQTFAAEVGARIIDPMGAYCDDENCIVVDKGVPTNSDWNHLMRSTVLNRAGYIDELLSAPTPSDAP